MAKKLYLDTPDITQGFEAVKGSLPGADLPWLNDLRATAMAEFSTVGLPGPHVEEWKYTNLGFLANENFDLATAGDQSVEAKSLFDKAYCANIAGPVAVFINGYFSSALSSLQHQDGAIFTIFSQNPEALRDSLAVTEQSTSLNNLNRAMATDGYSLEVSAGVDQNDPLQIIHIVTSGTDGKSLRTRARITAEAGAKAHIIESFVGADGERYWAQQVSDVSVAEGAEVTLTQFQQQGKQAIHMAELYSHVSDQATFNHMSLQIGAEISRTELINSFTGEKAYIDLRGAYLGRVKQSHDIFTRINHDLPNCDSNQLYRGVLDEGGRSAFQGKVVVARDAQKTNADQSNKNLLLSRKAEANAKPELLIYADDVKCSHGATVGELDSDQLFYLRSRGLDEDAAKGLLVEAFVSEVFDDLDNVILRDKLKEQAAGWLKSEEVS